MGKRNEHAAGAAWRTLLVAGLVLGAAGCSKVTEHKLQWDLVRWREDCFGSRTVGCVSRKIDLNLRLVEQGVKRIKQANAAEKAAGRPSLNDEQMATGLAAIDSIIVAAAEKQRPNVFARWFLRGREYWDVPRYFTTEFITPDVVEQVFIEAVIDYNRRHGLKMVGLGAAQAAEDDGAGGPAAVEEPADESVVEPPVEAQVPAQAPVAEDDGADQALAPCIERWISAYRQEMGEEAIVSYDQLGEWEQWCRQGREP